MLNKKLFSIITAAFLVYASYYIFLTQIVFTWTNLESVKVRAIPILLSKENQQKPFQILIYGDSRMQSAINPKTFEAFAVNLASPGGRPLLHWAFQDRIKQQKSINENTCVVLQAYEDQNFSTDDFLRFSATYDLLNLNELFLVYQRSIEYEEHISNTTSLPFFILKAVLAKFKLLYVPLQPIQNALVSFQSRLPRNQRIQGAVANNGFYKISDSSSPETTKAKYGFTEVDLVSSTKNDFLFNRAEEAWIKSLVADKHRVFIVYMPYRLSQNNDSRESNLTAYYEKLSLDIKNVKFIKPDLKFSDSDYFNNTHLNILGAQKISNWLASYLSDCK